MSKDFPEFPKIARLSRECTITEKIDGTNALIDIEDISAPFGSTGRREDNFIFRVGSRTRWITPEDDNYGFARWARENKEELLNLGAGRHYGEWWGSGIQKRYKDAPKKFSLFNTYKWSDAAGIRPKCCDVVPVLYNGIFFDGAIDLVISQLKEKGSFAHSSCMNPEGIIIWHHAAQIYFKKTLDKDEEWKGKQS